MTHPQTTDGASTVSDPRTELTSQDVARKAIELCEADPDHVYEAQTLDPEYHLPECHYVHEDEDTGELYGGCLFGRALIALGVPAALLRDYNDNGIGHVLAELGIDPRPEREQPVHPLAYVQGEQDVDKPWGSDGVLGGLVRYVEAGR